MRGELFFQNKPQLVGGAEVQIHLTVRGGVTAVVIPFVRHITTGIARYSLVVKAVRFLVNMSSLESS